MDQKEKLGLTDQELHRQLEQDEMDQLKRDAEELGMDIHGYPLGIDLSTF